MADGLGCFFLTDRSGSNHHFTVPNDRRSKNLNFVFLKLQPPKKLRVLRFFPVSQRFTALCCEFCPQIDHKIASKLHHTYGPRSLSELLPLYCKKARPFVPIQAHITLGFTRLGRANMRDASQNT